LSTGAGKGDSTRPTDRNAFGTNHEAIFGVRDHQAHAGATTLIADPKTGHLRKLKAGESRGKKNDNTNFVSKAMGCSPKQVPAMMKRHGDLGVKYDPNGNVIFPNRKAKLAMMKRRGMIDHDEVVSGKN